MGVIHKYAGQGSVFEWEGVSAETYTRDGAVGGSIRVVVGPRDGARNFVIRYVEIASGGQSSLDRHEHDHGVYILKGKARVLLGRDVHEAGPGDVVYIPPNERHRFENIGDEPLGFLCVIPPKKQVPDD